MAGVTIEELGLRFVQICNGKLLEWLSAACIFSGRYTLGYFFTAGEKNLEYSCIIWSFWHLRYIIRFL